MAGEVTVPLPRHGVGFRPYKGSNTQYGKRSTIDFIETLGRRWHEAHPIGPRLLIGDLSVEGGGPTPNGGTNQDGTPHYHKSHREGRDFDVQLIRADGHEMVRSTTVSDTRTVEATQELVDLIHAVGQGRLELILSATHAFEGNMMRYDATHTYHLHVRLRP